MKIEDNNFPVMATGNRIYASGFRGAIATCCDDEMAIDLARRLNMSADVVMIREINLGNPAHIERLLRPEG